MADFDEAYAVKNFEPFQFAPRCEAPACFVGNYPPVTPAGSTGPFFVNSYFLRPDRKQELGGPVPIRSNICS